MPQWEALARGSQTPEKRRSLLEDLSDLGEEAAAAGGRAAAERVGWVFLKRTSSDYGGGPLFNAVGSNKSKLTFHAVYADRVFCITEEARNSNQNASKNYTFTGVEHESFFQAHPQTPNSP